MDSELISSIRTAIEQGRSDIVRSLLEACDKGVCLSGVLTPALIDVRSNECFM
jgi:hypothetical protein